MNSKAELRKRFKELRQQLNPQEIENLSQNIFSHLLLFLDKHPELQIIHLFLPIKKLKEVDTLFLLPELHKRKIQVLTSSLSNDGVMQTVLLKENHVLHEDNWGIPVPNPLIDFGSNRIDLVLVPLLVWDKAGNRIGYGKGHYDRFLQDLPEGTLKIGLSFFDPVIEPLEMESHDVALDKIIYPEGIWEVS